VGNDTDLGDPAGLGVTLNGGTLQTYHAATLAATRGFTLKSGGGTIDVAGSGSEIDGAIVDAAATHGQLTVADSLGGGALTRARAHWSKWAAASSRSRARTPTRGTPRSRRAPCSWATTTPSAAGFCRWQAAAPSISTTTS